MSSILGAIEHVTIAALIGQKMLAPHKGAADRILTVLSAVLCAVGVLLLIVALERYLESLYRPDIAAAVTAAITFSVSFLVILIAKWRYVFKPTATTDTQNSIEKSIKDVIDIIHRDLNEPIRENPKTAVLIAALAGFAATRLRR